MYFMKLILTMAHTILHNKLPSYFVDCHLILSESLIILFIVNELRKSKVRVAPLLYVEQVTQALRSFTSVNG